MSYGNESLGERKSTTCVPLPLPMPTIVRCFLSFLDFFKNFLFTDQTCIVAISRIIIQDNRTFCKAKREIKLLKGDKEERHSIVGQKRILTCRSLVCSRVSLPESSMSWLAESDKGSRSDRSRARRSPPLS